MAKIETNFERRRRRNRAALARVNKALKPRLSVHRTNKQIYAQIIDTVKGVVLASASTMDKDLREKLKSGASKDAATETGKLLAQRAKKAKIADVQFDRGGLSYHGRVKALADGAREGGMKF